MFEKKDPFVGVELFNLSGSMLYSVYNLLVIYKESSDDENISLNSLNNSLLHLNEKYPKIMNEIVCNNKNYNKKTVFDGNWTEEKIRKLKSGVFQYGEDWKSVSYFIFMDDKYSNECMEKFNSFKSIYNQIIVKEWIGPGAMWHFLTNLTQEKLEKAKSMGFSVFREVKARAEADNKVVIESYPLHIAARFNIIKAVKLLLNNGARIGQLDHLGNNALSYAMISYFQRCTVYLLTNRVKIQDKKIIQAALNEDDAVNRVQCFLCYSDNIPKFISACKKANKKSVRKFISFFDNEKPYCFSSCKATILFANPNFKGRLNKIDSIIDVDIKDIIRRIKEFKVSELTDENLMEKGEEIIEIMNSFVHKVSEYNSIVTHSKSLFDDFFTLIKETNDNIDRSIDFLEGRSPDFISNIQETVELSPFLHCAISMHMNGRDKECLEFLREFKEDIKENYENIQNDKLTSFFSDIKAKVSSLSDDFAECMSILGDIRAFIDDNFASKGIKESFSALSDLICLGKSEETEESKDIKILSEFKERYEIAQASFRMGIANLRIIVKPIGMKFSDKQDIYQNLIDCDEILDDIKELEESREETLRRRVLCSHCNKYVACYVCPECGFPISCMKCGAIDKKCPKCNAKFSHPFQIKKNSFFGRDML